jgi:acetyl-CoA acetyltransferase
MRIDGVAVAGVGMVRFGKYPDRGGPALARDAALAALHDAGLSLADVDEAFVGYIQPASLLGIKAVKELGLTGLPVTHVENASATGLVAFREAAWAVASGRAEVALALAFDKMTDMARGSGSGRGAGRDQIDSTILPAAYFALWAQRRMHDHGTRPEHFAAIAAKNWNHGALCPWSDRRPDHRVTPDEVLGSQMVAEPLTARWPARPTTAPRARSSPRSTASGPAATGAGWCGPRRRRCGPRPTPPGTPFSARWSVLRP